jgi:phosphatidylserine/phosphatidylglycerophosphate/cardiolipin synthase-like enzyme
MTPQIRLRGDTTNSPSLSELVTDRANAGVTVRSMLWYVPGTIGNFGASHGAENLAMSQLVEDLGGEAVQDNRLPNGNFASHHQKFIVLGNNGTDDVAFIGGIDIAPDRWDTPLHEESDRRQPELFEGWHDVQAEVAGPAVGQLWDSFAERWNDPRLPCFARGTAGNSTPTPIPASARPSPDTVGTCYVQVLYTYPCQSNDPAPLSSINYFPFATGGDRSYESGLVKAIDAAEYFVYIEDQYLWPCAVVDALANAVARGVTVICLLTNHYDVVGLRPWHNFLRQHCLDQLRAADPDHVFVFHLQQDGLGGDDIYVHAKTLIIDDRYAVIGTGNINRRSMRTDTEIAIAVVDATVEDGSIGGEVVEVCRFAKSYRERLWSEHLGVEIDDPLKSDGTPHGWPTEPGEQIHHALVHQVPEPRLCRPAIIPFVLMNPETSCP